MQIFRKYFGCQDLLIRVEYSYVNFYRDNYADHIYIVILEQSGEDIDSVSGKSYPSSNISFTTFTFLENTRCIVFAKR